MTGHTEDIKSGGIEPQTWRKKTYPKKDLYSEYKKNYYSLVSQATKRVGEDLGTSQRHAWAVCTKAFICHMGNKTMKSKMASIKP